MVAYYRYQNEKIGQHLILPLHDYKQRTLQDTHLSSTCAATLDVSSYHFKIAKQAQSGMNTHHNTERAKELEKVRDLANQGVRIQ